MNKLKEIIKRHQRQDSATKVKYYQVLQSQRKGANFKKASQYCSINKHRNVYSENTKISY